MRDEIEIREDSREPDGTDRHGGRSAELLWSGQWALHHGDVLRYASYLLGGDIYAAEDVAQETAIRLWQHPEVLEDAQPLGGWLHTVARNIVIDRTRRRRARPTEVTLSAGAAADAAATAPDGLERLVSHSSVTQLLETLSPRHRVVVFEVYVRDRPIAAVAADLGIPTGTVKSRCHHALRQLRDSTSGPLARAA